MTAPSTPRCRLCEASEGQRFIDLERRLGWGQSFIHCSQCNDGYLWPDLSPERLSEFYRVQYRKLFTSNPQIVMMRTSSLPCGYDKSPSVDC